MFRKFLLALSAASITAISPLTAEEKQKGTYIIGSIGTGKMNDIEFAANLGGGTAQFEPGFSGEIGVGYDFGSLRTEFTYNSLTTALEGAQNVNVDVTSYLVSAAYDWRSDKKWQPYIGAGVGSSTIDVNLGTTVGGTTVTAGDDSITTVKLRAGVNYDVSKDFDFYGELWSQGFDDFTIGLIQFTNVSTSGASLGIRVKF